MKDLLFQAENMINTEYYRAVDMHGNAHSAHEAWGLLLEEIDELDEQIEFIYEANDNAWEAIKKDDYERCASFAYGLRLSTMYLIAEAAQVGAMARKLEHYAGDKALSDDINRRSDELIRKKQEAKNESSSTDR